MARFWGWLLGLGIGLALASACGTVNQGSPIPATQPPMSTSSASDTATASPTSGPATGPDLTALDPCALVSQSELSQLGQEGAPRPDSGVGGRTCAWAEVGFVLMVAVHPKKGLSGFNTDGATRVEERMVGDHRGRLVEKPGGSCFMDLVVTAESSVILSIATLDDPAAACPLVERAAVFIEPRVPRA